eukprot:scaffold26962_cov114-Isochrysis_galbana.AAC.7
MIAARSPLGARPSAACSSARTDASSALPSRPCVEWLMTLRAMRRAEPMRRSASPSPCSISTWSTLSTATLVSDASSTCPPHPPAEPPVSPPPSLRPRPPAPSTAAAPPAAKTRRIIQSAAASRCDLPAPNAPTNKACGDGRSRIHRAGAHRLFLLLRRPPPQRRLSAASGVPKPARDAPQHLSLLRVESELPNRSVEQLGDWRMHARRRGDGRAAWV